MITYTPVDALKNVQLQTLHQFPYGTWAENLAVREDGCILVTLLNAAELWQVDPVNGTAAKLIQRFPDATGLSGIAKLAPDTFAVLAGNISLSTLAADPGSFKLWTLRFRGPEVELVRASTLLDVSSPNGIATIDAEKGIVLIADCGLGVVWRVDTRSGIYEIVLEDETLKPTNATYTLGVNGIQYVDGYLYYDNTNKALIGRVPIHPTSGRPTGPYEVLAKEVVGDGLVVTESRATLVASNPLNTIVEVSRNGSQQSVVGGANSALIAGPTAIVNGGGQGRHGDVFFITTSGAIASPINGTYSEGGKVMALYLA